MSGDNPYLAPQQSNPYAPPETANPIDDGFISGFYRVENGALMVRSGAILPNRCIKTNLPVEPGKTGLLKKARISWVHPAWYLLIILNVLIMIVVVLCISKKAKIEYHLGHSFRAKRTKWRWLFAGIMALSALGFYSGINMEDGNGGGLIALSLLGFFISLVSLLFSLNYVSASNHREGWFQLKGAHPDFIRDVQKEHGAVGIEGTKIVLT
ncbi:MAG: hypothetical protein ACSHYF_16335 [Verrucomicrobiaceae bacterium]